MASGGAGLRGEMLAGLEGRNDGVGGSAVVLTSRGLGEGAKRSMGGGADSWSLLVDGVLRDDERGRGEGDSL